MSGQQLKIIYRGYGFADRFEDGTIELNKHLDNYPKLKKAIIQHEIKHTNNPKFNKKDFLHDLSTQEQVRIWDMMRFMFRHPFSLVQFLPIYYNQNRGLIIDKNLMAIYFFFSIIAFIGIYFGMVI